MKWDLLVTRETDLFERYLRVSGYRGMLGEASKVKIKNLLVVNNGGLNAQHIKVEESNKNQKLLWEEYRHGKLKKLIPFWQSIINNLKPATDEFKTQSTKDNFKNFLKYYYLSRGIVFYTEELSRVLESKKLPKDINILGHWHELSETESSKSWDSLKTKFKKFAYYLPPEFETYLSNKKRIGKAELTKRKKYYVLLMKGGVINFYTGQKAKQIERDELLRTVQITSANHIKGHIASKGYAKGRARIVNNESQMKQMKKGEVLISIMTTPRLISAVKKAVAIVTNEGGITSHAAIIAREFKIPCIIGTKFATSIFNNGDMVEVDANKGIVRKI